MDERSLPQPAQIRLPDGQGGWIIKPISLDDSWRARLRHGTPITVTCTFIPHPSGEEDEDEEW